MKLFKSSKKKKESESNSRAKSKSRSGLFGSRKKNVPQTKDARSSSFSSQTDTALTISPQWLHGNGVVNVNVDVLDNAGNHNSSNCNSDSDSSNNKINSNSKISCHDQTLTERFGEVEKNPERNNPFDKGGGDNDAYHPHPSAISSSGSERSDSMGEGDMESSAEVLTALLAHLTEKERKEWADGAENSKAP